MHTKREPDVSLRGQQSWIERAMWAKAWFAEGEVDDEGRDKLPFGDRTTSDFMLQRCADIPSGSKQGDLITATVIEATSEVTLAKQVLQILTIEK